MESGLLIAIITFVVGFLLGVAITWLLKSRQQREAAALAEQMAQDAEARREKDLAALTEHLKLSFGNISNEVLSKASDEFMKVRKTLLDSDREISAKELESKKTLIDQQLQNMNAELDKVQKLMTALEKDRSEKFGQLSSNLESQQQQVQQLMQTASSLREALASTKARGQWGERMAEDVLRLAGFIEGVNYEKQKTIEGAGTRPDFTFPLPQGQVLNMDVKFPLDNYLRYLEAESEDQRNQLTSAFVQDIKNHIKAVSKREYINPQQNTLAYALMFIPNEQVYAFVHEHDASLIDRALESRVILCSPLTLYAILAVIRQAADNFALERTSHKMVELYGEFQKQWGKFCEGLAKLGRQIETAHRGYEEVAGTRSRQLEKVLNRIEDLRTQKGMGVEAGEPVDGDDGELPLLEESRLSDRDD